MTSSLPCALAARSPRARAISTPTWLPCTAKGAKASLLTMNYGWIGRCWRRKNEPSEAAAQSSTLVLTLIPIVLSAMRISAVANGDRATLVTQLSALDVKSTLLGTFVWPLPTTFGVVAANVLDSLGVAPSGARTGRLNFWLAIMATVMALVLSTLAPVNEGICISRCRNRRTNGDVTAVT